MGRSSHLDCGSSWPFPDRSALRYQQSHFQASAPVQPHPSPDVSRPPQPSELRANTSRFASDEVRIGFIRSQNEWPTTGRIGQEPGLSIILFGSIRTVDSLRFCGCNRAVYDAEIRRSHHIEEFRVGCLRLYNNRCFIRRFYGVDCIGEKRRAALNILQAFPRPFDVLASTFEPSENTALALILKVNSV